jgi:uncharacterized protein (DUF1800 family)
MDTSFATAATRFGLGRFSGHDHGADPALWLSQQLAQPEPGPAAGDVATALAALEQDRQMRRSGGTPPDPKAMDPKAIDPKAMDKADNRPRDIFRTDVGALLQHAVATRTPFHERLVWFWANHFTISTRRGEVAPMVGAYVRDAIRPHVAGRFADMLLAVMRHPAMLLYLDNAGSAGPRSAYGSRTGRGLNENLARECLELHTVSPAAGYTQTDVTEFARVLTGWSVERREPPLGFRFRPGIAEPGEKTVLGRRIPAGEEGGVQALRFLADHPATHRHLATKLVRHFVADAPPADAIRDIEGVLRDTGGNLGAASLALTRLPAAWQPLSKIRTPQDYVIAVMRAAELAPEQQPNLLQLIGGLGQPPFSAPFPIGWPDVAADWTGPEALLRRVDWAYGFAARPNLPEPVAFAEAALGPLLSDATAAEIRRAGSRRDAITLLLASPEFQRR